MRINQPVQKQGIKVVVIDDDSDHRYILKRFIKRKGYSIDILGNYEEVEKYLGALSGESLPEEHHVFLIDSAMPEHDGTETAKLIRKHCKYPATLVLHSSYIDEDNLKNLADQGGFDYYHSKSHDPAALLNLLNEICNKLRT